MEHRNVSICWLLPLSIWCGQSNGASNRARLSFINCNVTCGQAWVMRTDTHTHTQHTMRREKAGQDTPAGPCGVSCIFYGPARCAARRRVKTPRISPRMRGRLRLYDSSPTHTVAPHLTENAWPPASPIHMPAASPIHMLAASPIHMPAASPIHMPAASL